MDKNPPIQGTGVQSLIQENPNASEQPSPYSTTSEPLLQSPGATTTEAQAPRAHTPQQEKPPHKPEHHNQRVAPTRRN